MDNLTETKLTSEKIYSGCILDFYRDTVRLPNGGTAPRELSRHVGAVCIVPLLDDGRVIVERQFRYPVNEVITEIPAGKRDSRDEAPEAAARRELREETGITARELIPLGPFYPAAAYSDEVIWMVTQIDHPLVGACLDTMNSQNLMEGIASCIEKMAPYTYCCHFCDTKIIVDPDGVHSYGCTLGEGSIDLVRVMNTLRRVAPPELDTIDLEIEMPLSMYTLEEGRAEEIKAMRKSIQYLHDVLDVGVRGR